MKQMYCLCVNEVVFPSVFCLMQCEIGILSKQVVDWLKHLLFVEKRVVSMLYILIFSLYFSEVGLRENMSAYYMHVCAHVL